jgi:hypothetical protein
MRYSASPLFCARQYLRMVPPLRRPGDRMIRRALPPEGYTGAIG